MARKLPQVITQEEFEKLFAEAKKQRESYWMPQKKVYKGRGKRINQYMIAMLLAYESGLRISEILGYEGKYSIPKLKPTSVRKTSLFIESGKGQKDRVTSRPKRLTDKAVKMLPLTIKRRALQNYVTELGQSVLKKNITFHTLRHGFATHFHNKVGDIKTLQILMGHSRLDTTSIYAHVNPEKAIEQARDVF